VSVRAGGRGAGGAERGASALATPKSVTSACAPREQHVVRLDVAVHDAARVRVGERARHVAQHAHRLGDGSAPSRASARAATRPRRTASCSTARRRPSPAASTGTTCGCCSCGGELDLAPEAVGADPPASSGGSTLTTTRRPSATSSCATNTRDMPPPPSSRSMGSVALRTRPARSAHEAATTARKAATMSARITRVSGRCL
jgi:hypothetical protein